MTRGGKVPDRDERSEIAANTGTNGCDDHAKLMTHMSLGDSVAGERHLGFPSRYVGVLFAFRTFQFGGSQF